MEFFTKEEFDLLSDNTGISVGSDHDTYVELKKMYCKVEYWADEICKRLSNGFNYKIVRKPTNQANKIETYQWAKIYPNNEYLRKKYLAFTISIDEEKEFIIKIDTVGSVSDDVRDEYERLRGDYRNSEIINISSFDKIKDWETLFNLTNDVIIKLLPKYKDIFHILEGNSSNNLDDMVDGNNKTLAGIALNQILYGPPGTGKTYNTINRALEIIEPKIDFNVSRTKLKEKFNNYIKEGRIVFTTFHQSMSYEDFIEGIKPETNDKGEINYEVQDGIFKKISKEASLKEERIVNNDNEKEVLTEDFFKGFYSDFANKLPDATEETSSFELETKNRNKFQLFKNPNTGTIIVKAGKLRTHQSVSLKTLSSAYFDNKMPQYPSYSYKIIEEILKDKSIETKALENNQRPYVLIIDEINRGNVSAIFGELITLIEDSKRLGEDEALTVTLPYSKEPFGVPPNLYIIGTMNTADRSVEALDTALRRRFVFEEMMPDYELLTGKNIDNISLKTILETINNRIEVLLSRDHLIGHSYFLEVDSWEKLNETFYKNIIPLLQEYFYGDYGKIGLVLGSGFVEKTVSESKIFGDFANDYGGYTEKTIFKIKPNNQGFNIQTAITELLKNGKKGS